MAPSARPQISPERFGRYVLLEKIGVGGMAEVFRAVAPGTGGFRRVLVLKRILPAMSRDARFVEMFIDEAKISALISHPNVVQVFEFGQIEGSHFLAMEYVHGRNLSAVMAKLADLGRTSPPDVIAEIIRQAALGLNHAHSMTGAEGKTLGIIHRDVTPANLMLGFNGAVKVLDFGIARAAEEVKETRTQAGSVKGKVAYLAPEQINRQPVDHRSDLFALGIVLHECLTGRRLFKADNALAAMKAILDMPIPLPSSMNPDVPPKLDKVVMRALQRKPELRYSSGKAMAMDLEAVLVEQRYFSQRLPNFLKEIFQDEVTDSKDRILPEELAALEALPEDAEIELAGSGIEMVELRPRVQTRAPPVAPPTGTNQSLPEVSISGGTELVAGKSRTKLWLGLGGGAAVLATGLVIAMGRGTPVEPSAKIPIVATPTPATPPVEPALPTTVSISVDSSPQGAVISDASGKQLGITPATLDLERSDERVALSISLAEYKPVEIAVIPDLDKPVFTRLQSVPKPHHVGSHGSGTATLSKKKAPKKLMPRNPFD
ncbi:MAG: serine/threonine-protein kinase [Deltaproteobacteria bacterium]|nr:serine/threonine-protein kinase [Deltaproteobacteria bacterium]